MPSPIVLVDVMNLVFRSHYAHRNLSVDGHPTGVLYGVVRAIADLQREVSRRMLFVWDHGVPQPDVPRPRNWRETFLPEYKANRKQDDAERRRVFVQLPELHRIIQLLGYSNAAIVGLEADDLIGIAANELEGQIRILSTDRDFYQLIRPRTAVLAPVKNHKWRIIDASTIEREYGITVCRWPAYLALGGDSSDNIKPCRGMGPKTAVRLVTDGAIPDLAWNNQPEEFRTKYPKLQPVWPSIQRSYRAAQIPTTRRDPRIEKLARSYTIPHVNQQWQSAEARNRAFTEFTRFCNRWEMVTLMPLRHTLFSEGKACPPNGNPPSTRHPWLRRNTLV